MAWWLMAVMPTRLPAADQTVDDVGAPEGLAGPRWALDGDIAAVEVRRPLDMAFEIVGEHAAGRAHRLTSNRGSSRRSRAIERGWEASASGIEHLAARSSRPGLGSGRPSRR